MTSANPGNGRPSPGGARAGVPAGTVARSVSPSGSKGQWHLHLPLPPAPGHVATEACAASVLAGPAGAGVGLGQDPRPGRYLGLLRRDWACGAWEEGMAEANVTPGGGLPAPPLPAQGKPRTDGKRQI